MHLLSKESPFEGPPGPAVQTGEEVLTKSISNLDLEIPSTTKTEAMVTTKAKATATTKTQEVKISKSYIYFPNQESLLLLDPKEFSKIHPVVMELFKEEIQSVN